MMYFKPRNEKMVENLVASEFFYQATKIMYLGGCLNDSNQIETSPDMLVFDNRENNNKILRCECKYIPNGINSFRDNGSFDIAIIWDYDKNKRNQLANELYIQNSCNELIILTDYKSFTNLIDYNLEVKKISNLIIEDLNKKLVKSSYETVWVAYIFCKLFNLQISGEIMMELLEKQFSSVRQKHNKGKANTWSSLAQKTINIIEEKQRRYYKWNIQYNPILSLSVISNIIINKFEKELPNELTINELQNKNDIYVVKKRRQVPKS